MSQGQISVTMKPRLQSINTRHFTTHPRLFNISQEFVWLLRVFMAYVSGMPSSSLQNKRGALSRVQRFVGFVGAVYRRLRAFSDLTLWSPRKIFVKFGTKKM